MIYDNTENGTKAGENFEKMKIVVINE